MSTNHPIFFERNPSFLGAPFTHSQKQFMLVGSCWYSISPGNFWWPQNWHHLDNQNMYYIKQPRRRVAQRNSCCIPFTCRGTGRGSQFPKCEDCFRSVHRCSMMFPVLVLITLHQCATVFSECSLSSVTQCEWESADNQQYQHNRTIIMVYHGYLYIINYNPAIFVGFLSCVLSTTRCPRAPRRTLVCRRPSSLPEPPLAPAMASFFRSACRNMTNPRVLQRRTSCCSSCL